jgi:hypothetical protein
VFNIHGSIPNYTHDNTEFTNTDATCPPELGFAGHRDGSRGTDPSRGRIPVCASVVCAVRKCARVKLRNPTLDVWRRVLVSILATRSRRFGAYASLIAIFNDSLLYLLATTVGRRMH